jgi:hypothetical protein
LSNTTVYRFQIYDIDTDETRKSRRWATAEAIKRVNGEALKDTAIDIDASLVGAEIPGMTARGFDPHSRSGHQTQVTS